MNIFEKLLLTTGLFAIFFAIATYIAVIAQWQYAIAVAVLFATCFSVFIIGSLMGAIYLIWGN